MNVFSERFLDEIFRPQDMCSKKAVKTIFERLAHTSIMRLNQNSMDKVMFFRFFSNINKYMFLNFKNFKAFRFDDHGSQISNLTGEQTQRDTVGNIESSRFHSAIRVSLEHLPESH